MTAMLEKALHEAASLGEREQDAVATVLLEEVTRTRILAGIGCGESDCESGQVLAQAEAKERMSRWLR
jgi:predicted transcriptional regulator